MAEFKVLKETEPDGEKLEAGDIIEVSPRQGAKLALEGVARPASFSDFTDRSGDESLEEDDKDFRESKTAAE